LAQLPIQSLEELLRALGRERSLRGRLRVLGRSWQLLRSLSPAERERVAMRVGSRWAWKRLEKSFLRDGELDETEQLVGRVFERLGDSDPAELRRLASLVRSRDRAGAQDLLLMTLREALEEEADAGEAGGRETQAPAAQPPDEPPERRVPPAAAEPPPERRPPAAAETPSKPPPPRRAGPSPSTEPEPELVDDAAGVLASSLARPVEAAAEPPPPTPVAAPEPPLSALAVPPEQRPPFGALGAPREQRAPFGALGGAERIRRLRALQREGVAAELGREGRARLVASLGGGWASRRALSHMIAAGALDDLDEALRLVAALARPSQQSWCLADLIEHWPLDEEGRARVLGAAPSDAARLRLARRAAAASGCPGAG
jgi:hypothetical protein